VDGNYATYVTYAALGRSTAGVTADCKQLTANCQPPTPNR